MLIISELHFLRNSIPCANRLFASHLFTKNQACLPKRKHLFCIFILLIYKEQNILFSVCAANFSEEEWMKIYRDGKDYAPCLGVERKTWHDAENYSESLPEHQGEVVMPGGHLTINQLTALLNTIPMEITFVDGDNINRFFNEGEKVFHRPQMAIDREVFSCHPPKIEPMVRSIIDSFRSGKQNKIQVWIEKNDRTMLVNYMAVRDKEGHYVGTAEFVQDMEFAKEHFLKNKSVTNVTVGR